MKPHARRTLQKEDEIGFAAFRTWPFWRATIVAFCIGCILGHWLEIPYCMFMDHFFGIVDPDYAVWTDPWYHPYWVYGFGAVAMTLLFEPFKETIILRRKTMLGAFLETFLYAVLLAMLLELVIGWLVNQPDQFGNYPYWDNSKLFLNVFGQAWLVNDFVIGLVAMFYIWVMWPLICLGLEKLGPRRANIALVLIVAGFAACCTASYVQLALR